MNQVKENYYSSEEIVEKIKDGKRKKIKQYPQHVCRASEIGHDCERYLVFSITRWEDRKPHGAETEFMFEGGRLVEDLAIKDFEDAGFKVYRPEPDKAIMAAKPTITGHIDIRVNFGNDKVYTGEIKGLNMYDWNSLNCLQDFFNSQKVWIRKYPAQLMTYLHIKKEEEGFFYLKSVPRFQPKFIWINLDHDYMKSILKKTERIEKHVADGTLPPPINNPGVCQYCGFLHVCLPEIKQKELEFIDDPDFETKLLRRDEIASIKKEYDLLDREIKSYCKGRDRLMVGDFLITGEMIQRKGYVVADTEYWKTKIARLMGGKETEE